MSYQKNTESVQLGCGKLPKITGGEVAETFCQSRKYGCKPLKSLAEEFGGILRRRRKYGCKSLKSLAETGGDWRRKRLYTTYMLAVTPPPHFVSRCQFVRLGNY